MEKRRPPCVVATAVTDSQQPQTRQRASKKWPDMCWNVLQCPATHQHPASCPARSFPLRAACGRWGRGWGVGDFLPGSPLSPGVLARCDCHRPKARGGAGLPTDAPDSHRIRSMLVSCVSLLPSECRWASRVQCPVAKCSIGVRLEFGTSAKPQREQRPAPGTDGRPGWLGASGAESHSNVRFVGAAGPCRSSSRARKNYWDSGRGGGRGEGSKKRKRNRKKKNRNKKRAGGRSSAPYSF